MEGAEWSVIAGMPRILSSCSQSLEFVTEVSPKRLAKIRKSAQQVLQVFATAGFNAYELVNAYSDRAYLLPRSEKRPTRLGKSIQGRDVVDLVFSKRNLDSL